MSPKVFIFWDNSNIFISAKNLADDRDGWGSRELVRVDFQNMFNLARGGREVASGIAVGSIPPELKTVWENLQLTGMRLELYERGQASGKEQGQDACLQVHMLRALADEKEPQVTVLLTGDGKGYDDGVGFHADLKRMADRGWGIEVVAWDLSCKGALKEWAKSAGVFIPLESYYESVTFIQGGRQARPLNLTHRSRASVKGAAMSPEAEQLISEAEKRAEKAEARLREIVEQRTKENEQLRQEAEKRAEKAEARMRTIEDQKAKEDERLRQMVASQRNLQDSSFVRKRLKQARRRARGKGR